MKRPIATLIATLALVMAVAQEPAQGLTYSLPKTSLRIHLLIEKRQFTPGRLAAYAEKYMKLPCRLEPETTYSIVGVDIEAVGVPDTAHLYNVPLNKRHTIFRLEQAPGGMLTAVNASAQPTTPRRAFSPAPRPKPLNAADYMDADVLAAASSAKMAELIAQDVYDIREARNQLTRGEADAMPADGAQLKLMMEGLNSQEEALMQVFRGTTTADTTETTIAFTPELPGGRHLLFRLSSHLGLTDVDDLGGAPFYVNIDDEHTLASLPTSAQTAQGKTADEAYLHVILPGRVKVTLTDEQGKALLQRELYAAQFGRTEALSNDLFGKRQTCHIHLSPVTGAIEDIVVEPLK